MKRQRLKRRRVDYLKFNWGTLVLLIGVVLFLLNLIFSQGATTELIVYIKWGGLLLTYTGLCIHLILVGDKSFFKSWAYLGECRNFIYLIVGVFLVFALAGFFIPVPDGIRDYIFKFIQELLDKTKDMSAFELMKFIFLNNLQSSFFGVIFGVLFGIFPVMAAIANGYLLGFVSAESVSRGGILVLWRLFPHGIFELPAVFISLALGAKFGTFIFRNDKIEALKKYFSNSLRVFFFIVIPLLIVAAIIEGLLVSAFG